MNNDSECIVRCVLPEGGKENVWDVWDVSCEIMMRERYSSGIHIGVTGDGRDDGMMKALFEGDMKNEDEDEDEGIGGWFMVGGRARVTRVYEE